MRLRLLIGATAAVLAAVALLLGGLFRDTSSHAAVPAATANDVPLQSSFPYEPDPFSGYDNTKGLQKP